MLRQQAADHLHPVVGTGAAGQVETTSQSPALGIGCAEHYPSHPSLHQRPCTHGAWLQVDYQSAVVEAPVAPQPCSLPQGDQFGMAQGVAFVATTVAPPANAPAIPIQ